MTIKDIARESGYAVSTVSRALNHHSDVSAEAREKIAAVVEKHDFVPNSNARQLKVQKNSSILILVKGVLNLFFSTLVESVQLEISNSGYSAEVHYLEENANEVAAAERLERERKPRGFLFLGGNVESFRKRFACIHTPSVLATTVSAALHFDNLCCVGIDDIAAGEQAFWYLYGRGHTHIALVGGNPELSFVSALRYQGFCSAAKKAGLPADSTPYEKSLFGLRSGYQAMQRLLERDSRMTAVFCMSDLIAMGAIRAICDAGLRVPQDISVLGFDGTPLSNFYTPRIDTIQQPQKEIAKTSVWLLCEQIEKHVASPNVVLPVRLLEGESVRFLEPQA